MSDPYVPVSQADIPQSPPPQAPMPTPTQQERALQQPGIHSGLPVAGINHYSSGLQPAENYPITAKSEYMSPASQVAVRRPQGYRPDDASGVRQIYRGPEYGQPAQDGSGSGSAHTPTPVRNQPVPIPVSSNDARGLAARRGRGSRQCFAAGPADAGRKTAHRSSAPAAANRDSSTSSGCCSRKSRGACFDAVNLVR